MPVEATLGKAKIGYLRQAIATGECDGKGFEVALNIDGKAIIIGIEGKHYLYLTKDMVQDAMAHHLKGDLR